MTPYSSVLSSPTADVDLRLQVQHHPDIAGRVHFEQLHHELVGADGGWPVNAVEAVAVLVLADAGGVRRHVLRATAEAALPRQVSRRHVEVRQLHGAGVDEDALPVPEPARQAEEAEGVAAGDGGRTHAVEPAPGADGGDTPGAVSPGPQADDALHGPPRQVRGVIYLQPELGEPAPVAHRDAVLRRLPLLEAVHAPLRRHLQAPQVEPRPEVGEGDGGQDEVGEPEEEPEAGGEGAGQGQDEDDAHRRQRAVANQAEVVEAEESVHGLPLAEADAPATRPGSRLGRGRRARAPAPGNSTRSRRG